MATKKEITETSSKKPTKEMTVFDPLTELERAIDRRFRGEIRDLFDWPLMGPSILRETFYLPSIDVVDKGDYYKVTAELPGVHPDDIDLSISGSVLNISGEWKSDETTEDKEYVHRERRYGSFCRDVPLPTMVDPEKVKANFEDGVLELEVPKAPEAKTRKIGLSVKPTTSRRSKK